MKKLVSIIINSYNYGRFLSETIDSALNQDYAYTEVIVVDDGSTDNSVEIINSYTPKIIRVFKENGGQGSAFNSGFFQSKGDIIIFVDSDDTILPTAAKMAVDAFERGLFSKVDWKLKIIDEFGIPIGQVLPKNEYPVEDLLNISIASGPYYDWHITSPTTGNAWSRKFLEQIFPMPEEIYRTCADEYLLTLSPVFGQHKRLIDPQGCYRSHGANNGWGRNHTDVKLHQDIKRFEYNCLMLHKFLSKKGVAANITDWHNSNWNYKWMQLLLQAKKDININVPHGETLILIDDYDLGRQCFSNYKELSFLELNGHFLGNPADSETAISRLQKFIQTNATYLIIWSSAFWWFQHYSQFQGYLDENYPKIISNEALILYSLK